MKYTYVLLLSFIFSTNTFGQEMIKRKIFSRELQDSISLRVWLPKDWTETGRYPAVYFNSYAVLGEPNDMLIAAHLNNFVNNFPPAVVVAVNAVDEMDYSYETGTVGKKGVQLVDFFRNELIPEIEAAYKTTRFRAFIGQSYSASYANYLFLNHPGLFNAFILLTPEKLGEERPPFLISPGLKKYYDEHTTFYYLASAENDMKRRQEYAEEIALKVKVLDSAAFHFAYQQYDKADHNSIINYGVLPGLAFIFKTASFDTPEGNVDIEKWVKGKVNDIKKIYGLEVKKTTAQQLSLMEFAFQKKDVKGMDFLAAYFTDTAQYYNSWMLFNTASIYIRFNEFEKAETFFKRAIDDAGKKGAAKSISGAYVKLANTVYRKHYKNFDAAWNTLTTGFKETQAIDFRYWLGELAVQEKFKVDQGIENLLGFIEGRAKGITGSPFITVDKAYLLLAQAYYQKHDKKNARRYIELAGGEEALKWRKEVGL